MQETDNRSRNDEGALVALRVRAEEFTYSNGKVNQLDSDIQFYLPYLAEAAFCLDEIRVTTNPLFVDKADKPEEDPPIATRPKRKFKASEQLSSLGLKFIKSIEIARQALLFKLDNFEINPLLSSLYFCISENTNSLHSPNNIHGKEIRENKSFITKPDADWLTLLANQFRIFCRRADVHNQIQIFNNALRENTNSIANYIQKIIKHHHHQGMTFIQLEFHQFSRNIYPEDMDRNILSAKHSLHKYKKLNPIEKVKEILQKKSIAAISDTQPLNLHETSDSAYLQIEKQRKSILKVINHSKNPSNIIGYCWRIIRGEGDGWKIHFLLILKGNAEYTPLISALKNMWEASVQQDFGRLKVISQISNRKIPLSGFYPPANLFDLEKEIESYAEYMTVPDYCLRLKLPKKRRSYGRGEIPRGKSN